MTNPTKIDIVPYSSLVNTKGILLSNISRMIPPPVAVMTLSSAIPNILKSARIPTNDPEIENEINPMESLKGTSNNPRYS